VTPRAYRLGRRAESAERTRERIVEATMALHRERGIAATTMKDIARRADVGVGTVYHHFPTYEDAIRACGARTAEVTRLPGPAVLDGARSLPERVAVMVRELFAYYDRHPTLPRARCEQDRFPVLAEFAARRRRLVETLAAEALAPLGPAADAEGRLATVVALTDFSVHRSLVESGLTTDQAAARVTDVLVAWLRRAGEPGPPRPNDH
jgi:AcrR family transcriptional regulator